MECWQVCKNIRNIRWHSDDHHLHFIFKLSEFMQKHLTTSQFSLNDFLPLETLSDCKCNLIVAILSMSHNWLNDSHFFGTLKVSLTRFSGLGLKNYWGNVTQFNPIRHFCTPWEYQKTRGFLTFSWGIEMEHWVMLKWVNSWANITSFFDSILS